MSLITRDLLIYGVPQLEKENTVKIFKKLCAFLKIKMCTILNCFRLFLVKYKR